MLAELYGRPPLDVGMGGSIPVLETFQSVLGLDTVFFSFAVGDEDIHAPNEFFRVPRLYEGQQAWAQFWWTLATEETMNEFQRRSAELNDLLCVLNVLNWDARTQMPAGGSGARAQQMATISALAQEKLLDPAFEAAAREVSGDDAENRAARQALDAVSALQADSRRADPRTRPAEIRGAGRLGAGQGRQRLRPVRAAAHADGGAQPPARRRPWGTRSTPTTPC